ncbi:MAG: TolC family protein [Azoarcus sp.]|jgi:outer membrane protein TolC|nr:TolC family protein [Azoarcus sp.]
MFSTRLIRFREAFGPALRALGERAGGFRRGLFATLFAALASAFAAAQTPSPDSPLAAAAPSAASASSRYPAELPPEAVVRSTLAQLPELQAARANIDYSTAERRRLQSGPYEWNLNFDPARRRTRNDGNFNDYEVSVNRPVRWFGKAGKDQELGQQAMSLAEAAYADVWHEAGRALLAAWFELLREERAVLRISEQVTLSEQLLDGMQKRVRAGDTPKMELMLAQTENQRLIAVQQQAAQRAKLARIALEQKYPGLSLPPPITASEAPPLPDIPEGLENADWVARIISGNHELEQAQAQTRQKELLAERSALERTPDPTIGLRYTNERNGEDRIVGVAVSIPLPGEARRAGHAGALAQLDQARQEETRIRNKVELEARQLLTQVTTAKEIATTQARIRDQAQSNAALVTKAYTLGESAFADTLLAGRQALEAAQAAETAHLDALELHARLLLDAHLIWHLEHDHETTTRQTPPQEHSDR